MMTSMMSKSSQISKAGKGLQNTRKTVGLSSSIWRMNLSLAFIMQLQHCQMAVQKQNISSMCMYMKLFQIKKNKNLKQNQVLTMNKKYRRGKRQKTLLKRMIKDKMKKILNRIQQIQPKGLLKLLEIEFQNMKGYKQKENRCQKRHKYKWACSLMDFHQTVN